MRPTINQLAFAFCKFSGLNILMRFRNRKRARVLMYHAVSDTAPDSAYWTVVTTDQFRKQLRHLKRHYRTVSGTEFSASKIDQLHNRVLITFDDGHVNTLTTALPELKRFGHPALCFVIPGLSASGRLIWADELHNRMIGASPITIKTSLGEVRLETDPVARNRTVNDLIERMKTGSNDLRLRVIGEIEQALPPKVDDSDNALKLMSKEEIVRLSQDETIEIGTHTDTHPILSRLTAEEQIREIQSGLDRLRSWGVDGSIAFAYPNGRPCDYNLDSIQAAKEAGIKTAFTTSDGFVEIEDAPYEFKRIPVGDNTSQNEFEARLSGAYYLVRQLSGRGGRAALRRKSAATLVSSVDQLAQLRSEWDKLALQSPRHTVFLDYDWLMSWWEVHGGGRELYLLRIDENDRLAGLAPFMITSVEGRRIVEFIGTPDADYGDFIGPDPEKIAREAINWLLDNDDRWDLINLAQVSELSPTYRVLRKVLNETGANWFAKPMATCYRYNYTGDPDKRDTFQVKHSRSLRNLINRLRRSGNFKLEIIRDTDRIKAILPDLYHLHITRWAGSLTPSYFEEESNRRFIERLVERLAPAGRLFLCVSWVDRLPVCYTLNFDVDRVMTGYTLAYNQFFFRLSPGRVHGILQSEHLVQQGYDLDLSRGDTPFKRTINAEPSYNFNFTIYRSKAALLKRRLTESFKGMRLLKKLRTRPGWGRRVETLNLNLRHRGLVGTVTGSLSSLLTLIYSSRRVALYRFTGDGEKESMSDENRFSIAEIDEINLDRFLSFSGTVPESEPDREYREMLKNGYKCCLLEQSGLTVASAWYKIGGEVTLDNGRNYQLSERQAMITNIRTSEAFKHFKPIERLLARLAGKLRKEREEILAAVPINRSEEQVIASLSPWRQIEINSSKQWFGRKQSNRA